ncbi:emi5 [Candida jiufengensis]|uniref:emi5 n=1 Tax=Candida jiufengensis TaxID=497108 RepID=UPI002224F519|nr:emi5 [Candida jiufengensis]KAI5951024.1 emi5 [Candida jiufengensis]
MYKTNRLQSRSLSSSISRLVNHGKPQNPPIDPTLHMRISPIVRTGESIDVKRARLVYQSRKRGILESDLLLSRFAKKYLNKMTMEELDEYDKLLDEADWDIYYWATKNFDQTPLPDKWKDSKILKSLQEEAENKEKVILRMPELDEDNFLNSQKK